MGIFAAEADLYRYYRVDIQMRERLLGGIPRNPEVIEGWLRSKADITSGTEEMRQAILRTLEEQGVEVSPDMTFEQIAEASKALAGSKSTNGFKFDDEKGLYIEGRQVKAGLRESTNIHFAGERWGRTKKGPKSYVAERIFVLEDRIHLTRTEPDGIELVIGHVTGAGGPRSTLSYHEYVTRATLQFHVMEAKLLDADATPSLTRQQWAVIWSSFEENGLGALRSQGHGRFDVTAWEEISREAAPVPSPITVQALAEADAAGGD